LKAAHKALELKMLKDRPAADNNTNPDYFFVKCDGKIEKVLFDDLLYIEAMANYVTLYTADDKLVVYLTIKGVLEQLPADKFMQVHKSYIINTAKVNTIEGNMLHLGNAKITIGSSFNDEVMDRLLKNRLLKR
jgi:DNA-binding LytR/AlgR family response regulator